MNAPAMARQQYASHGFATDTRRAPYHCIRLSGTRALPCDIFLLGTCKGMPVFAFRHRAMIPAPAASGPSLALRVGMALLPPSHHPSAGCFRCQSVARSKTLAIRSSFSSANGAARSYMPMGKPPLVKPQGILIPGMPARLAVMV